MGFRGLISRCKNIDVEKDKHYDFIIHDQMPIEVPVDEYLDRSNLTKWTVRDPELISLAVELLLSQGFNADAETLIVMDNNQDDVHEENVKSPL